MHAAGHDIVRAHGASLQSTWVGGRSDQMDDRLVKYLTQYRAARPEDLPAGLPGAALLRSGV